MMSCVVNKIQNLGVEVEHIPGGCTGLCQPVDVGINKPFKTRIKNQWESWMMEPGRSSQSKISPPTRKDISLWIKEAIKDISEQIVINSWRHDAFTWFPPTAELPPPTFQI